MSEPQPKIALVMRSFLDYRVPVFAELSRLLQGQLWILYSRECTPERVQIKLEAAIGSDRAIGFEGEWTLGYKGNITGELPNTAWRIPYQSGIVKRLRQLNPDVVVGDGFFQWTWLALAYHLVSKKPLVVCYERTAHTEREAQWYRKLYRKSVLKFVGAMAVNGRLTREYVESMGMRSKLITEGQMAADTSMLSGRVADLQVSEIKILRDFYARSDSSQIYLTINRLIPLKGIDRLLIGWRDYKAENGADDALLIIGEGVARHKLEEICASSAIPDVHFLGAIEYDSVYHYYAIADWFIMPSLVDNWSLVVPEAMACGLPILCSSYNGCWPELVHDDVNGWIFDPLKSDDISRVLKLSSDTKKYAEMADASRRIVQGHTPDRAAEAIRDACVIALERR